MKSAYGKTLYKTEEEYLYVEPIEEHKHTLIWTHGLGDSAYGFVDLFFSPNLEVVPPTTKVVLLTAPNRAVTINGGMEMPSWFDILSMELEGDSKDLDYAQLHDSYERVKKVIDEELALVGNDWSRLHLRGFSQGAALTYYSMFTLQQNIGSVVCLSGYIPKFQEMLTEKVKEIPIFSYHGKNDAMVPVSLHEGGANKLKDLGMNLTFQSEEHLEHSLSQTEIEKLSEFYKGVMI